MSRRIGKTSSKEGVPKRSSAASARGSSASSARGSSASTKAPSVKPSTSATTEKKAWDLPALSVPFKPKLTESEFEKLKKKTIRRNAPPGENIKRIKEIVQTVKRHPVSVQEFLALVAPSTGDQGEALRVVMKDDLNSFRNLARKVYDTITQDNSDVLLNQQLQISEYYREKKNLLHDKMMRQIEEIYMMAPTFDFDRYAAEKEKYLLELFPIPAEVNVEPEEMEMMKRQAAYHRLQWLRSEGERLNEENNSLKKRLNQLKKMHKDEQSRMMQMEKDAESKRTKLEATQAEKVDHLEMLNESLEKTIIDKERDIRESQDKILQEPVPPRPRLLDKKKKKSRLAMKQRPAWNEEAAREIETRTLLSSEAGEVANVARPRSPFHYSPPPDTGEAAVPSPFHYQTRVTPPPAPPKVRTPADARPPPPRRGQPPPRDTWGGFY